MQPPACPALHDALAEHMRRVPVPTQEPLLALLRKHIDAKGKQAKLKSPSELQVPSGIHSSFQVSH